jgi:hypothetical protein
MGKLDPSVEVPILLIADNDVRRRGELRRLFSSIGVEHAVRLLGSAEDRRWPADESMKRTSLEEGVR